MELGHVETFVTILREGGFTRASRTLHLSQPAISRRIRQLERELGAPLFERVPTGVVLTEPGRAFLPHAESLLASMTDGVEAVSALRGTTRGSVRIAIVGTLATSTLTARLRSFRAAHPDVELELRTALSVEVSALVRRGDVALGLRYRHDPDPDVESAIVYDEPLVPVCAADHRLAAARSVEPADLAGERWVRFPGSTAEPYSAALDQLLAAGGLSDAPILPIDSLTAQKQLVEAGFGIALLPASAIGDELRSGALHVIPLTLAPATIPVALLRRRGAFVSAATRALTELLQDLGPA